MIHLSRLLLLLIVASVFCFPPRTADAADKPNIVFILTDNQGAWQLGCYGNPDFQTPNIDRIAKEGVRFTNAFANNAVCSPTRATYLTGLTPSQHGVHRYLGKGGLQIGPNAKYTLEEFTTLPEVLHREGYVNGLSGKWHLGDNANPQDGFSFWVTKQHGHSLGFLNQEVLEDGEFKIIEKHLSEYWTDRGIEFIDKTQKDNPDKPFFLFLAYNGPYTLTGAVQEPVPSPWSDPYVDSQLPSFPRPEKIHPWQRNQHNLIGNLQVGRNLAGQVTAVDSGVGRIMAELKKRGLDENTLVIYAADQGAVAGHAGFWGMGDHSKPLHGRDGTMHIPMIFRWPGKIPEGKVEDGIVTNYDFMPSVLSLLGMEMPKEPLVSPGRDFSPALRGKTLEKWDDLVFYEFENVRSVRTKEWKYTERLGEDPEVELHDLKADPDELNNLARAENHRETQVELQQRLHAWFKQNSDPQWDLWNGGDSKSRIGVRAEIKAGIKKREEAAADPSPKHAGVKLQGLHAYADKESVEAGGTINFQVSSEIPYRYRVTKLGLKVDDRSSDVLIHEAPKPFPADEQEIHPGSYVKLKKSLPAEEELKAITFECWIRPWSLKKWQGILTQHDHPENCGVGLFLNGSGQPVFLIGSGGEYEKGAQVVGPKLGLRKWHHLAASWDGEKAVLHLDGKPVGEWSAPEGSTPRKAGAANLRIGAYGSAGEVSNFFDGDIALPAIYGKALKGNEIAIRVKARGLSKPEDDSLIAFWPLDEERGVSIEDGTGNGFDGEIINHGTWMTGGPSFDGASVGRYDTSYDPDKDTERGHALRLASDDLYDCKWDSRHSFQIPKNAKSGIYSAWFDFKKDGVDYNYPVTFIVKKSKAAKTAPLAVMCSTTTWRAYNGTPFALNNNELNPNFGTSGSKNDPANPTAYNFYRDHSSGQPSYQVGLRLPWPAAGPGVIYGAAEVGYSHLMRAERFLHVWLEKQGYDFDVITNLDLHRDPDLLKGYKSLLINGHDEYWSREMYEGLDQYLKAGGTSAVLSGNTMFWRITVDDELGVIECRKYGPNIGGRKLANVGEIYHSFDKQRGSLMRNCGLPPWQNIGLECSGWWGGANNGVYTVNEKAQEHFLFQKPEKIDFSDRQIFGGARTGPRKAGGHEGDIRLSSFSPPTKIPEGTNFPEEPEGIETLASLKRKNARVLDYFANFGVQEDATLVDMIYWKRPQGGTVFNAGAISFGWALDADPKQTKLMRNVLFHLAGVKARTPYDPEWMEQEKTQKKKKPAAAVADSKTEITPETDHALILPAAAASLDGGSVRVNPSHGALAYWKTEKDAATWKVRGAKNGTYAVVIDYAVPAKLAGQEFVVKAGDSVLKAKAASSGGWGKWVVRIVGEIEIKKSDLSISLSPSAKVKGDDLLDLRSLQLIPTNSPRLKNLKVAAAKVVDANVPTTRRHLAGNKPAPINPARDGVFTLTGARASLYGDSLSLIESAEPNHPEASIGKWSRKGDRAEWELRGLKAGRYDLLVDWAMPRVPGGLQKVEVDLDGQDLFKGNIRTTEGVDKYAAYVIGTVELPAGDRRLSFGPAGLAETWVRLRSLRLVPAAEEGEFTMPDLKVPEGFIIEPVAIPPLVSHPMMACLDDRGRMFVSESAGTNAKAPELLETRPHKILMLEDEDGDGVFDKSTVFADKMVLPNGAQWHDGSLYVCSPPYIWKLTDTDEDGVADERTPVGGKFGFNGMSSAFHGPVLGPDGRMYWCGGQHGWTLGDTSPGLDFDGPWVSRGPGVFSMWPDGSDPENRAQGGLANPVEVTFSSEGEVFGTVAVYENLNGRTDALLHWIHGTVYNLKRRGPQVHPSTSRSNLPPMSRRGWVAPPGLTRYRSGGFANGFGEEYRDDIFLTEFNTHRVYRIKPERVGASYQSTDEVFLESTSPYTHFTDTFEDVDGSLLVVDTGGWFLYGCPTSAIERPEIKGGIYRIRRKDSKPVDDPGGRDLDWWNPSVDWLDDPRFVVRDRAKTVLAKQGESIIPKLHRVLLDETSSERQRREAVWTLTRIDHDKAREAVSDGLSDSSASVRLSAARSSSVHRHPETIGALIAVLEAGDEPQIIREVATALGRLGTAGGPVQSLMKAVRKNGGTDRYLDHSLIYALIEIDHENYTRSFLEDKDPNVRRAALIASSEMKSSKLTAVHLAPHLAADDPDLRAEALRLAIARPEWGGELLGFLKTSLEAEPVPPAIGEALLAFVENEEVQGLVGDSLSSPSKRALALEVVSQSELKAVPESWKISLGKLLRSSPDQQLVEAMGKLKLFGKGKDEALESSRLGIVSDPKQDSATRLAAIELGLSRNSGPLPEPVFSLLTDQLNPGASTANRIRASRILGEVKMTPGQELVCAALTARCAPLEIGSLLNAFDKNSDPEVLGALAAGLADSPGLFGVSASRLQSIFGVNPAAELLIVKLSEAESQRDARIDELSQSIAGHIGDAEKGKAAFDKATCRVCHKSKGEGGVIGPELTTIGAIRSSRDLLEAIAFPSATFAREYEPFIVTMQDGSIKAGRLGEETEDSLELIDAAGQVTKLANGEIASREMASVSMMPPGLERLLTPKELADLVAYLKSLK